MKKSSIYLPDELKGELSALAARAGRSEAELIRRGIERLLAVEKASEADEAPVSVAPRPGPRLIGVGLGPGNPGHVTAFARDTLVAADRVFTLSWTSKSIGNAEAVLRAVTPAVDVQRLVIEIGADAAGRARSMRAAAEVIAEALDAAEVVAVALLGDPALWSSFPDLSAMVTELRPQVPIETVPGISAFQVLASRAGIPLAGHGQRLVVVEGEPSKALIEDPSTTVVIYKGSPDGAPLREIAERSGRLDSACLGERVDMPGERIEALEHVAEGPVSYLATVIFPAKEAAS